METACARKWTHLFSILHIHFYLMKTALITGVTGQDGSYLAELLLSKGYQVHGIVRRSSSFNRGRIDPIYLQDIVEQNGSLFLHYGDLSDSSNLNRLLRQIKPNEIYNLAAQSHVGVSFEVPEYTADIDALGTLRLLDAVRDIGIPTRLYQASTSELYGNGKEIPQNEDTPFQPCSPYATAKLYAYWSVRNYRDAYGLFGCNGILFNHESPRRGESFVTRKISIGVAKIGTGLQQSIKLGNLDAQRDWGYAPEYVEGMWRMLQHEKPSDYVLATGETRTVREFVEKAFKVLDIEIEWVGSGVNEKGIDSRSGIVRVEIDPRFYRPMDVELLVGDASKAKDILKWEAKTTFSELVEIMVEKDFELISQR